MLEQLGYFIVIVGAAYLVRYAIYRRKNRNEGK